MSRGLDASIVIPARNEECNLPVCLDRIFSQQTAASFEVIVVDSGSSDRTAEIAERAGAQLIRIRAEEFHHGRTRNLGARRAVGTYLAFLSADAWPQSEHWLHELLRPFGDARVGAVCGRQVAKPGAKPERQFFMEYRYGAMPRDGAGGQLACPFSTVNGALRRAAWLADPFAEDLNAYEDLTWAARNRQKWRIVYSPGAAVCHSHDYPMWYSMRQYFDGGVVRQMRESDGLGDQRGMASEGVAYLRSEMAYLRREGHARRIPYVAAYELLRYCGLALGRRHRVLPRWLKRRLSTHGLFA